MKQPKLASGSPEARLARAMESIFRTQAGKVLHEHLSSVAMGLSALRPLGATSISLADARSTDLNEGRRWLAVELLGARNNVRDIEGD